MTEREDAPSDRLVAGESDEWPVSEESDGVGDLESDQDLRPDSGWQWGDQWPPDGDPQSDDEWPPNGEWDWTELPYDDPAWVSTTGSGPSHRPADRQWYRRPGYRGGLIITALVALVVASVLLLTRATFSEQDEVPLKPTIRTSSVVIPSSATPTSTAASPTTSATEPTRSSTPSEGPEPAPEPPPAPAGPTAGGAIGEQDPETPLGPRTNVTRTPMSFTPGSR